MAHPVVNLGDTVIIDYTIKLPDGTIIDTTLDAEPMQFRMGDGEIIPGLEKAIMGMNEGDSKNVILSYEDAYGPRIDDLVQEVPLSTIPVNNSLSIGQTIEIQSSDDEIITAKVIDISNDKIKIDCNHFLAGRSISVEFKIIEVLQLL